METLNDSFDSIFILAVLLAERVASIIFFGSILFYPEEMAPKKAAENPRKKIKRSQGKLQIQRKI